MGRSMEKSREGLCELIEKVNILYNGFSISKEIILDVEKRFLTEAFDEFKTLELMDNDEAIDLLNKELDLEHGEPYCTHIDNEHA